MPGKLIAIAVVTGFLAAGPASAGEETRVVSASGAVAERFDFDLSVVWAHDEKRALIKRERESQSTGGQIAIADELVYRQRRDLLRLQVQAGVYRDVSVFLAAPLVLGDVRTLDFDRPSACTANAPGCVDESNATILHDGILPGFSSPSYGIDAPHDRPFDQPSDRLFRGPTRHGLESLGLGVRWAVLNQARDDTKPTWIVALEGHFSLGQDMRFDPARPNANTGVALGYHQLIFSTVVGRRFGGLEPYLGGSYLFPIATPSSVYEQYHLGGSAFSRPQHRVGAQAGVEAIAWEDERSRQRIAFLLRGHLDLRLFGLAQSDLWEPLSGSPLCAQDAARCRPGVDVDFTGDGAPDPSSGVTRSPAYGVFGGDAGLSVQLGRFRFRALFGLTFEESHFLTDARSGNEIYDVPGRRFKVEDGRWWRVLVEGAVTF